VAVTTEREKLLVRLQEIDAELMEIRIDIPRFRRASLNGDLVATNICFQLRETKTRFAFERDDILRQLAGG
jgi:hypothetical protein